MVNGAMCGPDKSLAQLQQPARPVASTGVCTVPQSMSRKDATSKLAVWMHVSSEHCVLQLPVTVTAPVPANTVGMHLCLGCCICVWGAGAWHASSSAMHVKVHIVSILPAGCGASV